MPTETDDPLASLREMREVSAAAIRVHDRDDNASQNLKTTAEQFAGGKPRESEALADERSSVKLPAMNEELNAIDSVG
jgi:hypothetical protein